MYVHVHVNTLKHAGPHMISYFKIEIAKLQHLKSLLSLNLKFMRLNNVCLNHKDSIVYNAKNYRCLPCWVATYTISSHLLFGIKGIIEFNEQK